MTVAARLNITYKYDIKEGLHANTQQGGVWH